MTLIDHISTAILSAQPKVLWQQISHPHLTWVYVRDVTAHVLQIQALNTCMIKLFKQIGHGRDSGGGGWGGRVALKVCAHRGPPNSAEQHKQMKPVKNNVF